MSENGKVEITVSIHGSDEDADRLRFNRQLAVLSVEVPPLEAWAVFRDALIALTTPKIVVYKTEAEPEGES